MRRVATAAALVPLVLAAVVWAPLWLFTLLLAVVAVLAAYELFALLAAAGLAPYRVIGAIGTAGVVVVLALPLGGRGWVALGAGLVVALLVRALCRPERASSAAGGVGAALLAVLYCGLLLGLVGAIRNFALGEVWVIFLLVVVWVGDTAALYAGRAWGRHRMAPRVSPKKTWEGSAASFVVAVLLGAGFGAWVALPASAWPVLELAAVGGGINVAAQVGDLVESLLKRGAQVKDSGALLPGHGGVLDRVDALLFAAPLLWYYLAYFHQYAH